MFVCVCVSEEKSVCAVDFKCSSRPSVALLVSGLIFHPVLNVLRFMNDISSHEEPAHTKLQINLVMRAHLHGYDSLMIIIHPKAIAKGQTETAHI